MAKENSETIDSYLDCEDVIDKLKALDDLQDKTLELELKAALEEIRASVDIQEQRTKDDYYSVEQLSAVLERCRNQLNLLKVYFCKDLKHTTGKQEDRTASIEAQETFKEMIATMEILLQRPDLEKSLLKFKDNFLKSLLEEASETWRHNVAVSAELCDLIARHNEEKC